MRHRQSGFTLVEIAIVLVIIGLLLGGVLKGQELINSAKAKSIATEFRNTSIMISAYQDRFRVLPGDDPSANTRFSTATPGIVATTPGAPGNGAIEGAWNSNTNTDESVLFWQHVRLANLATGSTLMPPADAGTLAEWLPRNSEGGRIGVSSDRPVGIPPAVSGRIFICQANINGRLAQQIETTLDDGNGQTGSVAIIDPNASGGPAAIAPTALLENNIYIVCMGV